METRPNAIITGGGRRLGRHIVTGLLAGGYRVAYSTRDRQAIRNEPGSRGFAAELSDVGEVQTFGNDALEWLGGVDLLVNNAGVIGAAGLADIDARELDEAYEVNVRSAYALSLHCVEALRASRGSIVNIASVGGLRPYGQHPAYSISKAGTIMMTRVLAKRFAPEVRVNAIAPGTLWIDGEEEPDAPKPPRESIPLGEYGRPEHVVAAVLFLARAAWTTGAVLQIDGGATLS